MKTKKLSFQGAQGDLLDARLSLPLQEHPHTYVLFAHCFTCQKNLNAIWSITRRMTLQGFAVLSFDFTGLGESEGDFASTNFSSNVEDLVAASDFMARELKAPELLIGHSLGGAASLLAAQKIQSVRAVATLCAPATPNSVKKFFVDDIETIRTQGYAEVRIGSRPFTIKKQFIEDIEQGNVTKHLHKLDAAVLILHAPTDEITPIENATKLYKAARHPKSFISLDQADHLLTHKADALYAAEVISAWALRYLDRKPKPELKSPHQVAVRTSNDSYTSEVVSGHHQFIADEPESVGGNNFGPSPYDLLSASLGACTAMTLQMYAKRKKWPLEDVIVHVDHKKEYPQDSQHNENPKAKIDQFERRIELIGPLDETQKKRLLEIADKCPVHKTLHNPVTVDTIHVE